jgi:hypothetical protein
MRLTFFQYVVLTALTAQIVSAVELSASRAARDNTITNTAAASSHSTLRADEHLHLTVKALVTFLHELLEPIPSDCVQAMALHLMMKHWVFPNVVQKEHLVIQEI